MDIEKLLEALEAAATQWGMKGIGVLLAVLAGWATANSVSNRLRRALEARNFDLTLTRFFANLVRYSILVSVGVACLGVFGVQTISFAGLIAAAGLAIGLALQGTLTNFASGVMLLIFRPFKVGDHVKVAGVDGVVEAIDLFTCEFKSLRQPPADRAQQRHLRRHHRQRHALPRAARGREHQQPLRRRRLSTHHKFVGAVRGRVDSAGSVLGLISRHFWRPGLKSRGSGSWASLRGQVLPPREDSAWVD
jgi:uncharacterized membrane protein YiaA